MNREVLFVAGRDPLKEQGGGHSSYVRAHGRAAILAGFSPQLFCVSDRTESVETGFGTVHRVRSPFRPFRQLMIAGHLAPLAGAIERFARKGGARCLIHGFGVWGRAGVLAAKRLARNGIEATAIISSYTTYRDETASKIRGQKRGSSFLDRALLRLEYSWIRLAVDPYERKAYRHSRLVLINYESVRRLIEKRYRIGALCEKIRYSSEASFAAEAAEISTRSRAGAVPLIVSVARHDFRKGNDILIEALARLRRDGIAFRARLIGEGPLLERNRAICRRLDLDGQVAILGFVPDVSPHLREADVFVLPSLEEQSGSLALIEALQARVAVVASGVDGIPEDVEDGRSAILVTPADPGVLASALRRVLAAPGLRRELAAEGRRIFEACFAPQVFSSALAGVYERLGFAPPVKKEPMASTR